MTSTDPYERVDRELLAVLVTLEPLGDVEVLAPALKPRLRICDFQALREQRSWSHGEQALIDWAEALWTGQPTPIELPRIASLDDMHLKAALSGVEIYRGRALPSVVWPGAVT